jgi:hypothetical protein
MTGSSPWRPTSASGWPASGAGSGPPPTRDTRPWSVATFCPGRRHRLSVEQLAWRRAKIRDDFLGDERTFRQEFPATAAEAFLVSGDGFFDPEALPRLDAAVRPPHRGTFVRLDGGLVLRPAERGLVRVWEQPDVNGHYVIGADTAEGRMAPATDRTACPRAWVRTR